MCGGNAAVTAISSTVNTPTNRKGALRMWWLAEWLAGAAPATLPARTAPGVGAGACRSTRACSGAQTNKWMAASTQSACRQSSSAISQAISGMNTVLASPPRKVSVMIARRKSLGKRRVTMENAGL